jgi:hypothetical protein
MTTVMLRRARAPGPRGLGVTRSMPTDRPDALSTKTGSAALAHQNSNTAEAL